MIISPRLNQRNKYCFIKLRIANNKNKLSKTFINKTNFSLNRATISCNLNESTWNILATYKACGYLEWLVELIGTYSLHGMYVIFLELPDRLGTL